MNKLQTTSILSLREKIIHRKTTVVFDCARNTIFGNSSNCGSKCRSDGTSVEYTRTAKGVLRFWGTFSIGVQTKDLFVQLHVSPSLRRQSGCDDEQFCKHRKSMTFGCVFCDANLTCKDHWNITQGLNNTTRKWDTYTLRCRIFLHKVVSIYRYT